MGFFVDLSMSSDISKTDETVLVSEVLRPSARRWDVEDMLPTECLATSLHTLEEDMHIDGFPGLLDGKSCCSSVENLHAFTRLVVEDASARVEDLRICCRRCRRRTRGQESCCDSSVDDR